jgi:hypothetical protein
MEHCGGSPRSARRPQGPRALPRGLPERARPRRAARAAVQRDRRQREIAKSHDLHEVRLLRSISCQIMGVNISCIASGILLPGQTMVFGRDMNEAGNIDRR